MKLLDALAARLRNKIEEARLLQEQFKNSNADGVIWRDYWKGREDGLVEVVNILDDERINADQE